MNKISRQDKFGFLKTDVDVHTMGMVTMSNVLKQCGFKIHIASPEVMKAVESPEKLNNGSLICKWIVKNSISVLSFSYRLDPQSGYTFFCKLYNLLKDYKLLVEDGGSVKLLAFSGLPDTCDLIRARFGHKVVLFKGGESFIESLKLYGIGREFLADSLLYEHPYDKARRDFAVKYIESEDFKNIKTLDHFNYQGCGSSTDNILKRLEYAKLRSTLPIVRVHAGPYLQDRLEAIKEFKSWVKELAHSRILDVLSIGSSQLTQQHFGEKWDGLSNGGGVPINSEIEYREIAQVASPMLVRTYAGTKDVPWMAKMHERTLNIAWHALSFWWFCKIDGRGDNTLLDNIKEHIESVKYIASTGKPLEPNVPHHFSFRGGDDVTYIISGYIAAKIAKKYGIRHVILQNMLNTPKQIWGIQDLAKGRVFLKIVRELEDDNFSIHLQARAGLDYFKTDLNEAKIQLAEVTALMDDIEPDNPNSPEIIHVVNYSEAVRLANPDIIKESIRITVGSLNQYRKLKMAGKTMDVTNDIEISNRIKDLYTESKESINILEKSIPNLYTAEGLYTLFKEGFFPVPYLIDYNREFPKAIKWSTAVINGAVRVVDEQGEPIYTPSRYKTILSNYEYR